MWKRKRTRAGLVQLGLLLLSAPAAAQQATLPAAARTYYAHRPDTGLLPSPDSLLAPAFIPDSVPPPLPRPELPLHPQAGRFIPTYIKKNGSTLDQVRASHHRRIILIDSLLRLEGLPPELKYLAVIESKLSATARSSCGAVGLWQLMPATARMLGLRITRKSDERTHTVKSTRAAARYLHTLHQQFGDWLLVIAAYNAGPGHVQAAIRKSGSRDFWRLQHHLPLETRLHVRRYIGAHWYFEGQGGYTTLTRWETDRYEKKRTALLASSATPKAKSPATPSEGTQPILPALPAEAAQSAREN